MTEALILQWATFGGVPAIAFAIYYFTRKHQRSVHAMQLRAERDARDKQAAREDRDRQEHLHKWDSMIEQQNAAMQRIVESNTRQNAAILAAHKEQMERHYKITDRQAQTLDLTAVTLQRLTDKIDSNWFCPIIRERSTGEKT